MTTEAQGPILRNMVSAFFYCDRCKVFTKEEKDLIKTLMMEVDEASGTMKPTELQMKLLQQFAQVWWCTSVDGKYMILSGKKSPFAGDTF